MNGLNFTVVLSNEDLQFVATCDQFPSLSYLADTPHDAMVGILKLVYSVIQDLQSEWGITL